MVSRRRLLAILGLGAGGTAVAVSQQDNFVFDGNRPASTTDTATSTPADGSGTDTLDYHSKIRGPEPGRSPTYTGPDFGYEPFDESIEPGTAPFRAVRAAPDDERDGDRLVFAPDGVTASQLAALLRTVWNVSDYLTLETTINGSTVEFAGGPGSASVALLATADIRGRRCVLVTRSANQSTAETLASTFAELESEFARSQREQRIEV